MKNQVRYLKVRIGKLKNKIAQKVDTSATMIHNSLSYLSKQVNAFKKTSLKMLKSFESEERDERIRVDHLENLIQTSIHGQTELIKEQSENLSTKIDHFSAHLTQKLTEILAQKPNNAHFIDKVKLNVDKVRDCKEEGVIGGIWTQIALKNHKSFLIATSRKGLKIFENGTQKYSLKLPTDFNFLMDAIYIPPLNCYFLVSRSKLYRKDMDVKPPYLYMDLRTGGRVGAHLRFSRIHERLIVNKNMKNISVINPMTREVEIEVEGRIGDTIMDFRLLGEHENMVVSVTRGGHITLNSVDYEQKTFSVITHHQEQLMKERKECPLSIAVCNNDTYVFVEIGTVDYPSPKCSRMIILNLSQNKLIKTASIDQYSQKIGEKWALECFEYVGEYILWVGISRSGPVQILAYKTSSEELKELEDKRVSHQEDRPSKFYRMGRKLYYTGYNGKLMSLSMRI